MTRKKQIKYWPIVIAIIIIAGFTIGLFWFLIIDRSSVLGVYVAGDNNDKGLDYNKCIKEDGSYVDNPMGEMDFYEKALEKGCVKEVGFDHCYDEGIPTMEAARRARTSKEACIAEGGKPVMKYTEIKHPSYRYESVIELKADNICDVYSVLYYDNGSVENTKSSTNCSWEKVDDLLKITKLDGKNAQDLYFSFRDDGNIYKSDGGSLFTVYKKK